MEKLLDHPMVRDLVEAAKSLEPGEEGVSTEYSRGVCELIGRFALDILGLGEGTGENAAEVAEALGLKGRA